MNEIIYLLLMVWIVVVIDMLIDYITKSKLLVSGIFALGIAAVIQVFNTERFPVVREFLSRPILRISWLTITNCSYLLLFTAGVIIIVYLIRYVLSRNPKKTNE